MASLLEITEQQNEIVYRAALDALAMLEKEACVYLDRIVNFLDCDDTATRLAAAMCIDKIGTQDPQFCAQSLLKLLNDREKRSDDVRVTFVDGPIGIEFIARKGGRSMMIKGIRKGSQADKCGKLRPGFVLLQAISEGADSGDFYKRRKSCGGKRGCFARDKRKRHTNYK